MSGFQKHNLSGSVKLAIILCSFIVVFCSCNKKNVEAPNDSQNIWGFGNNDKKESNTFQSNTATIAEPQTYTFFNHEEFALKVKEQLPGQYQGIYQKTYQDAVEMQIQSYISNKVVTIDHPFMIQNPYGTNSCSIYLYLGNQGQKVVIHYTVSAKDSTISDFSDTMYINPMSTDGIEGQIIGLIPGQQNKVVLDIRDESGNRISKKAYVLDISPKSSTADQRLVVDLMEDVECTRGFFSFLVEEKEYAYYVFYDNYGILRSEIPSSVKQLDAKILQADNQIFYEYSDNCFVLLDHTGAILQFYTYEPGINFIDYSYDSQHKMVLLIAQNISDQKTDKILQLNLLTSEWNTNTDCTELFQDYIKDNTVTDENGNVMDKDFIGLSTIVSIDGKDLIISAKNLNSIIKINNIYTEPVIRWIIAKEAIWKDTDYESLLLFETGKPTAFDKIDSMSYFTSRKLKEGQFYISLVNHSENEPTSYYRYFVDENQNSFRQVQELNIGLEYEEGNAFGYGTHIIVGNMKEKVLTEYNEKGEVQLRIKLPNMNSSDKIYKFTMDRYWF